MTSTPPEPAPPPAPPPRAVRPPRPDAIARGAAVIALLLALAGVIAFIWAVRSGQLDDLETPGLRILGDDDDAPPPPEQS